MPWDHFIVSKIFEGDSPLASGFAIWEEGNFVCPCIVASALLQLFRGSSWVPFRRAREAQTKWNKRAVKVFVLVLLCWLSGLLFHTPPFRSSLMISPPTPQQYYCQQLRRDAISPRWMITKYIFIQSWAKKDDTDYYSYQYLLCFFSPPQYVYIISILLYLILVLSCSFLYGCPDYHSHYHYCYLASSPFPPACSWKKGLVLLQH